MFNEVEQMPKSANLPLVGLKFNPPPPLSCNEGATTEAAAAKN
jgi:hypothetical protein